MSRYFAREEEQGKNTMGGVEDKPTAVEEVSLIVSDVQTGSRAVDSSDKDGHKNSTPRVCLYAAVAIILSGVVVTTGLVVSGRIPGHASPQSGANDVAMSVKAPRHSDAQSTGEKSSKNPQKKAFMKRRSRKKITKHTAKAVNTVNNEKASREGRSKKSEGQSSPSPRHDEEPHQNAQSSSNKEPMWTTVNTFLATVCSANILIGASWFVNWWNQVGPKAGSVAVSESSPTTESAAKDPASVAGGHAATNRVADPVVVSQPTIATDFSVAVPSATLNADTSGTGSPAAANAAANPPDSASHSPMLSDDTSGTGSPAAANAVVDVHPNPADIAGSSEVPPHRTALDELKDDYNAKYLTVMSAFKNFGSQEYPTGVATGVAHKIMESHPINRRQVVLPKFIDEMNAILSRASDGPNSRWDAIIKPQEAPGGVDSILESEDNRISVQLFKLLRTLATILGVPSEVHALAAFSEFLVEKGYWRDEDLISYTEHYDRDPSRWNFIPFNVVFPQVVRRMKEDVHTYQIELWDRQEIAGCEWFFTNQAGSRKSEDQMFAAIRWEKSNYSRGGVVDIRTVAKWDTNRYDLPGKTRIELSIDLGHWFPVEN